MIRASKASRELHYVSQNLSSRFHSKNKPVVSLSNPFWHFRTVSKGVVLMLSLVFIGLFLISSLGIVSMVDSQRKYTLKKVDYNQALEIAEAGLNYYRWHLAHAPTDYSDGTGGQPGPYVHDYRDPYGSVVGQFSLAITPPGSGCSDAVTITSTGWTSSSPSTKRKVKGKYGQKALTEFSFLTDSNVWFGPDEAIHGPLHSNGGIRMDGTHDAQVTSAKLTYICTSEHGCSNQTKPGVWGAGGTPSMWKFPTTAVDFNQITADLATLKSQAQSQSLYYGNLGLGYHVRFRSEGGFDIYRVKRLRNPVNLYNGERWVRDTYDIQSEEFIERRQVTSGCAIIFIEDNVWVDGVVNGKMTLVAARLPDNANTNRSIIINGNLTYLAKDGTHSIGLIAQKDVVVPLYAAPNDLEINGILLAQKGRVARFYYTSTYSPYHLRNSITLYGSIITRKVWTWSWVNSYGTIISGYRITNTTYDTNLSYAPPPGFPTQGEFEIIKWEEVTEK